MIFRPMPFQVEAFWSREDAEEFVAAEQAKQKNPDWYAAFDLGMSGIETNRSVTVRSGLKIVDVLSRSRAG
jgi:hypothetical protein